MCAIDRTDPDEHARRLAGESLLVADPTGWFERLYAAAAEEEATVPWDRGGPHPLLEQWAQARGLDGDGFRAVVVGCGLGGDAEYIAGLGFDTVAFDVAASAIESARWRFPESPVQYRTANLLTCLMPGAKLSISSSRASRSSHSRTRSGLRRSPTSGSWSHPEGR